MELDVYETNNALLCLILAFLFCFFISLRNELEDFKEKFDRLKNKFGILQEQNDALKIKLEESRSDNERYTISYIIRQLNNFTSMQSALDLHPLNYHEPKV